MVDPTVDSSSTRVTMIVVDNVTDFFLMGELLMSFLPRYRRLVAFETPMATATKTTQATTLDINYLFA